MIFDINQQLIYKKINELQELINEVFLVSKEDGKILLEELKRIEKEAIKLDRDIIETDKINLSLEDDSKPVINELIQLENKIISKLPTKKVEVDIEKYEEVIESSSSQLDILKETYDSFRRKCPSKLEINSFSRTLINKLLELLDNGEMTLEDLEYFNSYLVDIQLIKNVMFMHKMETYSSDELSIFKADLDRYNNISQIEDLFNYYMNKKQLPATYDFLKEEEIPDMEYPLYFGNNLSKLVSILTAKVYGKNTKNYFKSMKAYLKYISLHNRHFLGYYSFIFTKSNGLIVLDIEKIKNLDENDSFYDDIIGIVSPKTFFYTREYKNIKFIYSNDEIYVYCPKSDKLEFMACKTFDFSSLSHREEYSFPKLEGICVKYGSNSVNYYIGKCNIIDEDKINNKKELRKAFEK